MVDALTFYKEFNSLVTEQEFEDTEILCAQLNAFLGEWSHKMQTEVLQTDRLEIRLDYLENELGKIKELREQFDMPDCNLVYKK
jgi:3-oxoacyl-ACP reductase-like protein